MLRTRIITALVLLALLLPTIFVFPPVYWGLLTLVFVALAGWEWRTIQTHGGSGVIVALALLALGMLWLFAPLWMGEQSSAVLAKLEMGLLVAAVIYWCAVAPWRLRQHDVSGWGPLPIILILFACWVALVALREIGVAALLVALCIVWIADIGAYFVGRAIGKRKLAPAISPGKSWEGAIGGAFFVVVLGLIAAAYPGADATLPTQLISQWGPIFGGFVLALLAALSVIGDLHESLLKRQGGVKDSGTTLPGHGGVLDRVDALLPAMPAAVLLHRVLA